MEAKINLTPETLCLWGPIAAGWQPGATEMESQSGQNKKENMKFFLLFLASEFNVWHGKRDATDTKHGSREEIQQRSVINTGEVGQPINFGFSSAAGSHCHPHLSAPRQRFSALLSGAKETMGVEVQELSRQGSLLACWELANHFLQLVLSLGHHLQHVC